MCQTVVQHEYPRLSRTHEATIDARLTLHLAHSSEQPAVRRTRIFFTGDPALDEGCSWRMVARILYWRMSSATSKLTTQQLACLPLCDIRKRRAQYMAPSSPDSW